MRQPDFPPEPSAIVRPARLTDAAEIARVQVESWRTTYRGMVPDDYLDGMRVEEHTVRWVRLLRDPVHLELTFVTETADGVVGFAMGGREREDDRRFLGELYAIYLVREAQGRGYGRALVEAVARGLVRRRLTSMLVWVLRENVRARGFYERLGGVFLREHELDFGAGFTVIEVSYGWDDVRGSLTASQ